MDAPDHVVAKKESEKFQDDTEIDAIIL